MTTVYALAIAIAYAIGFVAGRAVSSRSHWDEIDLARAYVRHQREKANRG